MNVVDLPTALQYVAGVGAPILTVALLSFLAERWPRWNALPSDVKFIVPMLISVALSLGATWMLSNPELIDKFAPIFTMVMTSIMTYLTSQAIHQKTKQKPPEPGPAPEPEEARGEG